VAPAAAPKIRLLPPMRDRVTGPPEELTVVVKVRGALLTFSRVLSPIVTVPSKRRP
jgi:hypothetical protein